MAGASWRCCFNAALLRSPADGAPALPSAARFSHPFRPPSCATASPWKREAPAASPWKPHAAGRACPQRSPARAVRRRRGSLGACVARCPVSGRRKRHGRCRGLGWFHAGGAAAPSARYGVRPSSRPGTGERRGRARRGAVQPAGLALLAVPSARSLVPTPACPPARSCISLPVFALFFTIPRFIKPELPTGPPLALHLVLPWTRLCSSPKFFL